MGLFKKEDFIEYILGIMNKNADSGDYIPLLCKAHAIDLISRTIAPTELQVYRYDKKKDTVQEKKDSVYYRLNIKPNSNENATNFKKKLVAKLLLEGKALVILDKKKNQKVDYMYLADQYETDSSILNEKIFSNISLQDEEGNTTMLSKKYKNDNGECLYFLYENKKIQDELSDFIKRAGKLIKTIEKSYKSANINKWRLKNPGGQPKLKDAETGEEIDYKKYIEKITNGLLDDEETVILLSEIFDLILLNKDKSKDITDYIKQIEETGKNVAMTFNIPVDVFFGTKTEKSNGNNDFITFCCNPIMRTIEETLNSGLIEEKDFLKGEYIAFNKFCMQHLDLASLGKSLDKLTSIGFSFNQLCRLLNIPEVDEDWANEHHITKNYTNAKGGEDDGEG